jgi:hypothetical protein
MLRLEIYDRIMLEGMKKIFSVLFIGFLFSSPYLFAVDFIYSGPDCEIVYRFIPRTGTLNDLRVIYNDDFEFLPSYFGGITSFSLEGTELHPWEEIHISELLEETFQRNKYKAKFRWSYKGKSFVFDIKIWLQGKTLRLEFSSPSTNQIVKEFGLDRSEGTPEPKIIQLPYGHNVLYTNGIFISALLDPVLSNASAISPLKYYESLTSAEYGHAAQYDHLTDGSSNNLHETVNITVSPEISDTFYYVANPFSPYRNLLADKVIIDLWRPSFSEYRDDLQTLASWGLKDLFAIIHVWQKYGYDNGLPTTYPAGVEFGGDSALREVFDTCEANDYLFALHTNYVDFYENSDVWDPDDVALNPDGTWAPAWYNPATGMQSYLMKPSRCQKYARLYESMIHDSYRTNSAFLDVHTSVLPSFKVDFDASIPDAGKQVTTFYQYCDLISAARNIHAGPVAGEGIGFSANIWAGYIDALEGDPRRRHDIFEEIGGSDVPLIVDYKLKALHDLYVAYGAGYLERFFLEKWGDYSKKELEKYRVTEIAFGNAGFLSNPFAKRISRREISREYCFLKHLQKYYLTETPVEILYKVDDRLLTLSEALRQILPKTSADSLNSVLNQKLNRLKIVYSHGFTLYVNRSSHDSWNIKKNDIPYSLPPNGFFASKGNEFLAYSAIVDGKKTDYVCPAESICCETLFPPLNFSGQKVTNRSLSQQEYIHVLSWQANPKNEDISKYRIYQVEVDGKILLAELSSNTFQYWHRHIRKDRPYTYALVAVSPENREGSPAILSIQTK